MQRGDAVETGPSLATTFIARCCNTSNTSSSTWYDCTRHKWRALEGCAHLPPCSRLRSALSTVSLPMPASTVQPWPGAILQVCEQAQQVTKAAISHSRLNITTVSTDAAQALPPQCLLCLLGTCLKGQVMVLWPLPEHR